MNNRSAPSAAVAPILVYPDVREAVDWLVAAFGFVERVWIGENHRAQLSFGDGGGLIVAEHGAQILMEPTDFEYGERQYAAQDPAGHQWLFSQRLANVAPAEWGGVAVGD